MSDTASVNGGVAADVNFDESNEPSVVAAHFEDAEYDHLVTLIADMLHRLTVHNDQIVVSTQDLTRFHSYTPPSISIRDYLSRIVQYASVERPCLLLVLHYVDLICARLPRFSISSLTVHRFVIAAITCASKGLCDTFQRNYIYAKVGGIKLDEMNILEREFLRVIDWRLAATRELIQEYYVNLVAGHPAFTMPPRDIPSSSSSEISDTDSSAGTTDSNKAVTRPEGAVQNGGADLQSHEPTVEDYEDYG